jgi:hypothetical protein
MTSPGSSAGGAGGTGSPGRRESRFGGLDNGRAQNNFGANFSSPSSSDVEFSANKTASAASSDQRSGIPAGPSNSRILNKLI